MLFLYKGSSQTYILVSYIYSFILVLSISYVFRKDFDVIVVVADMPSLPMVYRKLVDKFYLLNFLNRRDAARLKLVNLF